MLEFEEGWDEHGRGLGKETSKVHIQSACPPEILGPSKTRTTEKDGQVTEEDREHRKWEDTLTIVFRCKIEARAHDSMPFIVEWGGIEARPVSQEQGHSASLGIRN